MQQLRYREAGFDCQHEIQAETAEEILLLAAEHVQSVHGLEITPQLVAQVNALIHDEVEE